MPPEVLIRPAGEADADAIAHLHAESWRTHYRGVLTDAYLDGPVAEERCSFWRKRLRDAGPQLVALVAERQGTPIGFACTLIGHDARWGSLIDNLHVRPDLKRHGLGRRLMRRTAEHLAAREDAGAVHLFVLKANRAAAAFYACMGGTVVEELHHDEPDGSRPLVERVAWSDAEVLLQGCGADA